MPLSHTDPLSAHTPPTPETQVAIDDAEVERVVRAMWEARSYSYSFDDAGHDYQNIYRTEARAAIRAIREAGRGE